MPKYVGKQNFSLARKPPGPKEEKSQWKQWQHSHPRKRPGPFFISSFFSLNQSRLILISVGNYFQHNSPQCNLSLAQLSPRLFSISLPCIAFHPLRSVPESWFSVCRSILIPLLLFTREQPQLWFTSQGITIKLVERVVNTFLSWCGGYFLLGHPRDLTPGSKRLVEVPFTDPLHSFSVKCETPSPAHIE